MRTRRGLVVALCCVAGVPGAVRAQTAGPGRVVDRIAAIVGSRAIMLSQLDEQLVILQADAQAKGRPFPTDSAGVATMRRDILTQMVEEELLIQQAERDTTVKVTEQEVHDQVEQTVQNVRRQYASEIEFQRQLRAANFGSVEEWRRFQTEQQRREILRRRLLEVQTQKGKLRPIPPTDAQMREFWERNKGQVQARPAVVSFRQIVVTPTPDSASRARTLQVAESLVTALRAGADFAAAARQYSKDSVSAQNGGELGWFRRGIMVKAFETAVFRLRPGEISAPVETEYGFHIIQMQRAQPAEVMARHILLIPTITPAQVEIARRRADSVFARLQAGAPFDSLARAAGDPNEAKLAEAVGIAQLPPEYGRAVSVDSTLGLKPVFIVGEGTERPKFVVVEMTQRLAAGDVSFDDVKDQVRQRLGQDLAIRHYLDQLRRQTYIDIRL
jgi:peptidyl-prolyl cis-trans isomerase SurA